MLQVAHPPPARAKTRRIQHRNHHPQVPLNRSSASPASDPARFGSSNDTRRGDVIGITPVFIVTELSQQATATN